MPDRILLLGATQTQQMESALFELGRAQQNYGNVVLTSLNTAVGNIGTSELYAREDHIHPSVVADTVANVSASTSTGGVDVSYARGDHVHLAATGTAPAAVAWGTSTGGVSSDLSRSDHAHGLFAGGYTFPARATGTVYDNNGSSLIFVMASVIGTAALEVAGAVVAINYGLAGAMLLGLVNPGTSYILTAPAGSSALVSWAEYVL